MEEKYQDIQCDFYFKNKRNLRVLRAQTRGVKYIVESLDRGWDSGSCHESGPVVMAMA